MVTLHLNKRLLRKELPESVEYQELGPGEIAIQAPSGKTIMDTLELLQIVTKQPVIAVVNGITADLDQILLPGDYVRLLPQISGGAR